MRLPDEWRADIETMQRGLVTAERERPRVDDTKIEGQLGDIGREEYVGRKRELEASLASGSE